MSSPNSLTDQDMRQAAEEAGISPEELRLALVERNLPQNLTSAGISAFPPLHDRRIAAHFEGEVAFPPQTALDQLQALLERLSGYKGHTLGQQVAAVVNERASLTYHLRTHPSGAGGSLVRVDIDTRAAAGMLMLRSAIVLAVTFIPWALAWLFSSSVFFWIAFVLTVPGLAWIGMRMRALKHDVNYARGLAARAVFELQEARPSPS